MKIRLTIFSLLFLISCFFKNDDYKIINDFLDDTNIRLENFICRALLF